MAIPTDADPDPGPGSPPPERRPGGALLHLRSSVLGRVLGALVIVLIVSTAVTGLVDARLTHSAVAKQTGQVSSSHLRVLQEAFAQRQRNLVQNLQGVANEVVASGLNDPAKRNELVPRLTAAATAFQLDQLDVVDDTGHPLAAPVTVGRLRPEMPITETGPFTTEPTSHLLRTVQGPFVQAATVALGTGARPLVLVGGLQFGDNLAYDLRRQVGGLANVILVAGSQVAGSTLPTPVSSPPAYAPGSDTPPAGRQLADLGGLASVVAYVPVGRSAQDPTGGALGIALADPAAPLDHDLAVRRLMAATLLAVLAVLLGWVLFRALTKPLVKLAGTAKTIADGQLDEPFEAHGTDEIAQLASSLEHMRKELQAKLEIVERQAAELQESSQRVVAAQDDERRRLARDLHDGIQQQLVVLRLRLGLAQESLEPEATLMADLGGELDRTIEQLREVSHDLYPAILRDRGLAAAVRSYAGKLPVPSTLAVEPDPLPRLPVEVESAAYFLLCEAVTNTLKHAGSSEVAVALSVVDGRLAVQVSDDGQGFDSTGLERRGGLLHMDDRVRSFGGELHIRSAVGAGTTVLATFPLSPVGSAHGVMLEPATP
ncbi:MAG: HAMP domain-containing sensor histidine kinase [Acidimicrobiales bacterium]